ncbi:MAG TPA: NlpC/P60 family protein [Solirubrobacteraceae bacterium]|nr:NlpC/P60 family protein [Solirubrobacteraceae bacterium]
MSTTEADVAAQLIERLLADPVLRARFRRDPAATCREAGLDSLAQEMSLTGGKAMMTLDVRESRSSLAGVMMAAAMEGAGLYQFSENVLPHLAEVPGEIGDVISRVNLPSVRGALAGSPARGEAVVLPEPEPEAPAAREPAAAPPEQEPESKPKPKPEKEPEPEKPAAIEPRGYPGDDASKAELAAWMGAEAQKRGLPPELPVMAALVESGLKNLNYGHADSVGFFQMRVGIWNQGPYEGYPEDASKQLDWFLDTAETLKTQRGTDDPAKFGEWIADVERPAEQYRYRYQLELAEAQSLLAEAPASQEAPAPDVSAPDVSAPSAPVDPAQYGAEGTGTGGDPSPESLALLENDNVVLDSTGVADLKAGRIDPRIVAVLTKLSEDHEITVSCMCSDHSKFTSGGSISNHHYGRGLDIAAVDGVPVNASNFDAREIAMELQEFDPAIQPNEIGTPWAISGNGYFTDSGHQDHLHVGFKDAIAPGWEPPAELQAAAPEVEGGSMVFAAVEAPAAPSGTLSFAAVAEEDGAGAEAEAPAPSPGAGGSKALAALEEAKKHLGTPYQWGGSTPETNFDCSGLVQWSYAQAGIQIPRVTDQQILAGNGTEVKRDDLIPGDLVFFRDSSGYVYHVGMSLGGDRFIHAPSTGDVVKISSLDEPYFAQNFTGGRRFDAAGSAPESDRTEVAKAQASVARDAADVRRSDSLLFAAVKAQEAANSRATVQFMPAVSRPPELAAEASLGPAGDYPGNGAPKAELAKWLAAKAKRAGLPPELPVMAALVESGVKNLNYGDADSVGFFQMRVGIWNKGAYAGYPERPELQVKWFIDTALAVKKSRIAAGDVDFGKDESGWGQWIADTERPAEQYRGRYQPRLAEARELLR